VKEKLKELAETQRSKRKLRRRKRRQEIVVFQKKNNSQEEKQEVISGKIITRTDVILNHANLHNFIQLFLN